MGNNADKEEFERFEKAFSLCRTCDHALIAHAFTKPKGHRCVEAEVKVTGEYHVCNCKLFIPKDNLEFLEWAAENKRTEKKS